MCPQTLHFQAVFCSKSETLKKCSGCTCIARLPVQDRRMPEHDLQYGVWCEIFTPWGQSLLYAKHGKWIMNMQFQRWLMCILHSSRHMTVKVAHCPYKDTLPLSTFQMGKHFLAQIFVLRKQTFAFASAGWGIQRDRATQVEDSILDWILQTSRSLHLPFDSLVSLGISCVLTTCSKLETFMYKVALQQHFLSVHCVVNHIFFFLSMLFTEWDIVYLWWHNELPQ